MTPDELKKANIDNLTDLWKIMGARSQKITPDCSLYSSQGWPYRSWFDWDCDPNSLEGIESLLQSISPGHMVPVWDETGADSGKFEKSLMLNGFKARLEQTAMTLKLHKIHEPGSGGLDVDMIHSPKDIKAWTRIASEAFGYEIDVEVITSVSADINIKLLLCRYSGVPAATALLYKTSHIIGVHQVGVAKAFQRKGIALNLMNYVISLSDNWNGRYITLQASAAGKGLYSGLGFKPQFMIRSYRRN
ncbi:GNAT family N-acetyltransferase [Dethiosulfatarculus sandiegensis]|uniref:N-acetyltransferase domain-containing protein n=1 Tax=Dethiosulfatarculus sandiegensis TaxID=1429043 RepID=A0A0D2HSD9_9BACT|nr:GNAT family N-acetyltransferase [Dethiosulfatarculus sandiegensis]KIX13438.1 hypothetical protein X474_14505 [Dethiosulfatarculus sandiegensis]